MANVAIDVLNETKEDISEHMEAMRRAVIFTLDHENFDYSTEISITIVSGERIRELNKRFRRIDSETDVLSFPNLKLTPGEYVFESAEEPIELGDIVISFNKAALQSEQYGHTLSRELSFLVCHSVLHLLGYNHDNDHGRDIMFSKQKIILENAGIPR